MRLLELGAAVDASNTRGRTALGRVAGGGHTDIVRMFVAVGGRSRAAGRPLLRVHTLTWCRRRCRGRWYDVPWIGVCLYAATGMPGVRYMPNFSPAVHEVRGGLHAVGDYVLVSTALRP